MGGKTEKRTESFEEILDKVLLPFREEYKQKCRNKSVIGGFHLYLIKWIDEALRKCPPENSIKKCLEYLRGRFNVYGHSLPGDRAKILKETHPIITAIKKGDPPPPIPVGKKIIGKDTEKKTSKKKYRKKTAPKLDDPIANITGVGPRLSSILKKMNLHTVEDILYHFPREYQDRRNLTTLDRIEPEKFQVVLGTLGNIFSRNIRRNLKLTKASLYDEHGSMSLIWFNRPHIRRVLKNGKKYIASGKVEYKFGGMQINSPEIEEFEGGNVLDKSLTAVYPMTEGLSQKFLRRIILSCVDKYSPLLVEIFPDDFRKRLGLLSLDQAIRKIHKPADPEEADRAKLRVIFEEAFFMQLMIARHRRQFRKSAKEREYKYSPRFMKQFEDTLHFQLTRSQRKVISEILEDIQSPFPMNRLLQGDVGSGKTIVCVFFALLAAASGFQAAIMVPTEVLAEQHFITFGNILKRFGVETRLLIGATDSREKKEIKSLLTSDDLKVVVGTHALIQEDVNFHNLAFAVVDEQHKFGVLQRTTLKEKGRGADFLFTTATPIPRSLCLSIYGELDVSTITDIPPGRQPIRTMWVTESEKERVYKYMEEEVKKGGQVYIICPLIEESEHFELTPLTDEYELVKSRFPDISVGLLHGRMKGSEKEEIMNDFSAGKYRVLVSTTVVEVGMDVPGASLMIILDAQRYGLGQLHQLRGRVGRRGRKSTCILVAKHGTDHASERLKILIRTNSGFDIAEEDLKIRGPGDIMGVRQSGLPELQFLDIVRDHEIIMRARDEAFCVEKEDPDLSRKKYRLIRETIQKKFNKLWDIIH